MKQNFPVDLSITKDGLVNNIINKIHPILDEVLLYEKGNHYYLTTERVSPHTRLLKLNYTDQHLRIILCYNDKYLSTMWIVDDYFSDYSKYTDRVDYKAKENSVRFLFNTLHPLGFELELQTF